MHLKGETVYYIVYYKRVRARPYSFASLSLSNFKKNLRRQFDVKSVEEYGIEKCVLK